ncbi:MAG: fatty acyl-AMP ligase [Rivularia sp. (in: cyanobacteria)]
MFGKVSIENQQTYHSNLVDILCYRGQYQPEKTAYTFLQNGEIESASLTYQEVDRRSRTIAAQLQKLGLAGERALLLYPPGLEFIVAFFGCLYAGVIAVPAYPPRRNQKLSRLLAIATDSQAKVAMTTESLLVDLKTRFSENSEITRLHLIATDCLDPGSELDWFQPSINSNSLAFLQYTSGSTGTPKGVMVSHGNLLHNLALIHNCFEHRPNSRGLIWLPAYHDMGLIGGVLQPIYGGFPVILMSPLIFLQKPWRWLQAISSHRATTSGGPNFAYDLCLRKVKPEHLDTLDLSSWKVAFTGAEPIRAETLEQFAAKFSVCGFRKEAFYPCYGMAETTLFVSGGLKREPPRICSVEGKALEENRVMPTKSEVTGARQIVGCGQAWLDQKIAIVDPESLKLCGDNQIGEIWVSGGSVAGGYWHRPEVTERTFNAYIADTGSGPFLRTGDLGFLQNGELFVTGRIKDVIIIRGRNHYPQDIELSVEQSHFALRPGLGTAFVVESKGEERLVIVQEVERSYLRKLDTQEVVRHIRRGVASDHNLQVYAVALLKPGSIPKTSSGKIQRHRCRTKFLNGTLDVLNSPEYNKGLCQCS